MGTEAGPDEASRLITVSPNPAARVVRIETPEAGRVSVFDALGREVASVAGGAGAVEVDVSTWPPGVYVVRAAGTSAQFVVAR